MLEAATWAIHSGVQQALAIYQQNAATLTPAIFPGAPATLQSQIQQALGNPNQAIPVHLGWVATQTAPALPGVWILPGAGQELAGEDAIGMQFDQVPLLNSSGAVTGVTQRWMVMTRSQWDLLCAAPNVDLVLALATLVRWALYWNRLAWGGAPTQFIQQQVNWGPLGAWADSGGDVIFPLQRTVTLTATHLETWSGAETTLATAAQATLTTP